MNVIWTENRAKEDMRGEEAILFCVVGLQFVYCQQGECCNLIGNKLSSRRILATVP